MGAQSSKYGRDDKGNIVEQFQTDWVGPITNLKLLLTDWTFIPQPNIHIPFKSVNITGQYTPYGRRTDVGGKAAVPLDLIHNNIALDQLGKGYVLQIGYGQPAVYGEFDGAITYVVFLF